MSDADDAKLTARYDFALDKFQLDAIASINDGLNVLVAAPTGSGKTVVAEYAVARAHRAGLRLLNSALSMVSLKWGYSQATTVLIQMHQLW